MRLLVVLLLVSAPLLAGCAEDQSNATPTPPTATAAATPITPETATVATPTPSPAATPSAPPATGDKVCTSGAQSAAEPTWVLETSMGTIRITLFCDKTPITAQNIVSLTEAGCYDGTKFHRVIKDFMDQGGDPLSKDDSKANQWGTGGPSDCGHAPDTIVDEFYCADGTVSTTHPATCKSGLGLKHTGPGALSMANTGRAHTGGSQFFLTAVATPWLDGKHAVFGHTADAASLEVALAINDVATGPGDRPVTPVVLEKATIEWS